MIKFSVYNSRLRKVTSGIIPSNAYGKLKFEFDFRTNDWDAAETKTAKFYYNGESQLVELDGNGQCYVPKEALQSSYFKVSVFGGDMVTNAIKIPIEGFVDVGTDLNAYAEIIKLIKEHTHEEYIEEDEIDDILPDTFDAGKITERS